MANDDLYTPSAIGWSAELHEIRELVKEYSETEADEPMLTRVEASLTDQVLTADEARRFKEHIKNGTARIKIQPAGLEVYTPPDRSTSILFAGFCIGFFAGLTFVSALYLIALTR